MRIINKRAALFLTMILVVFAAIPIGGWVASAPESPGSVDDPVVTKSYVDEQMQLLKEQMEKTLADFDSSQSGGNGETSLDVLELQPGETVLGEEGTEFIVRSGKVVALSGENGDGIPNVTEGTNIDEGELVPLNHLVLIPRTDGRGLKVTGDSPKSAWIIVRGAYQDERSQ